MIEVAVHNSLRNFLRSASQTGQKFTKWPHHLTMARLVARAMRLGRSALLQTSCPADATGNIYRFSYLMPILMWSGPVILVTSARIQNILIETEIPQLLEGNAAARKLNKSILVGDRWPDPNFAGLLLITPQIWLSHQLAIDGNYQSGDCYAARQRDRFPLNIPTIIDGADNLANLAESLLTVSFSPADWDRLLLNFADRSEAIRDIKTKLAHSILQHPINPYECYLLEAHEKQLITQLYDLLETPLYPSAFWQKWQSDSPGTVCSNGQVQWVSIKRQSVQFTLHSSPVEIASHLRPIWTRQCVVLIGGMLDLDNHATIYRQTMGLDDITCVKFSLDRQQELIKLYLPNGLPMPNTPQFQGALIKEINNLLTWQINNTLAPPNNIENFTVLLIGDVPLRSQIAAILAGEFGKRVQVEKTQLIANAILVSGWDFWRENQAILPKPNLLIVTTLPLPSLEEPLVSGKVAYYKQQRLDWFRLYLLPTALTELQRAISPVRESQGVVALLDNRVIHRSYGQQVLDALTPLARIDNLNSIWP